MKKYLIIGLALSIGIVSCKKDDPVESEFDAPYSELSVEESKTSVEDNGISLINEMDDLMESEAIDVATSFGSIAESLFDLNPALALSAPINTMVLLGSDNIDSKQVFASLKSVSEDVEQISEIWADAKGKYVWNVTNEEWDYTEGGDAIVMQFPGTEGGTSNTAEFKIDGFSYMTITDNAYSEELEGVDELPTGLSASLTYNDAALISYSFSASFMPDGMPTELNTSVDVDGFVFAIEAKHELNSSAAVTYSLKHDGEIMIEAHGDASGNWSQDNIDNNTEEHSETYTDEWGTYTSEWTEVYIENIIKNANAHIQLKNIKMVGMIDFANLFKEVRELDDKHYGDTPVMNEKEYTDALTKAINEYARLVVVYADNGKKIAVAEAYSYYYEGEWNAYWDVDVRFIFADESTVSAETYFDTEIDNLIKEINDLIADLNNEYDMGIDPVE